MSYTLDDIARGRELVAQLGRSQWALGDLALKIAPVGDDHANNGATDLVADFAEQIGMAPNTLRRYRVISAAWPEGTRVSSASYTLHRELMYVDDRAAVLDAYLASGERPSYRGLQKFMGKRPTPEITEGHRGEQVRQGLAEMQPAERAEIVRDALTDQATADQVFNAPDRRQPGSATARARSNTARAFDRGHQDDARRTEQQTATDQVGRKMSERSAQQNLAAACDAFAAAVGDELRRAGPLQDSERHWLFEAATRSGAAQAAVMGYIETGRSEIDADLDRLLAGEHGG